MISTNPREEARGEVRGLAPPRPDHSHPLLVWYYHHANALCKHNTHTHIYAST